MKTTRTQRFFSARSHRRGYDGDEPIPAHLLGDPTFVVRLSYKFSGPDTGLRADLPTILADGLRERPVFFLDANLWDVTTEPELWSALLKFREDVFVIPQVKAELGAWLSTHSDHIAARSILSSAEGFATADLPEPNTPTWDAYAYYVSLLALRRRVLELGEIEFTKRKGRRPDPNELVSEVQQVFGERGLSLAYKRGAPSAQASSWLMNTDESLVYLAAYQALISGRSTVILTKDQDVVEQFYKLWWFIDTHYRAMLLADKYAKNPFQYRISSLPGFPATRHFFHIENASLVKFGKDRMSAALPKKFDFVSVECWHLGIGLTRVVFGAERQMYRLLQTKGETGGLVSADLGAKRNLHPWLGPIPALDERVLDSVAIARDRSVPIVGSNARLGLFDATLCVNTKERFSALVPDKRRPSKLWTPPSG